VYLAGDAAVGNRRSPAEGPDRPAGPDARHVALEQFQQKCVAVLRPELLKNKEIEQFCDSPSAEMLWQVPLTAP